MFDIRVRIVARCVLDQQVLLLVVVRRPSFISVPGIPDAVAEGACVSDCMLAGCTCGASLSATHTTAGQVSDAFCIRHHMFFSCHMVHVSTAPCWRALKVAFAALCMS